MSETAAGAVQRFGYMCGSSAQSMTSWQKEAWDKNLYNPFGGFGGIP